MDELTPDYFNDVSPWEKLLSLKIDIGDFIMPLVFQGKIERIIWVFPSWEKYCKDYKETFNVGNVKGTSRFSCDSGHFIFSGEAGIRTKLDNRQRVQVEFTSLENLKSIDIVPENTLLDIDLDFFSTHNPALLYLSDEFNKTIPYLQKLVEPLRFENLCITKEDMSEEETGFYSNHEESYNLYVQYGYLDYIYKKAFPNKKRPISDEKSLEEIKPLIEKWCYKYPLSAFYELKHFLDERVHHPLSNKTFTRNYKPKLINILQYCVTFPHHKSSRSDILKFIKRVTKYLQEKFTTPPAYTTISMSKSDEHTPSDQVDFILNEIYIMIYKIFIVDLVDKQ